VLRHSLLRFAIICCRLSTLVIGAIIPDTETLYLSRYFRAEGILLGCWLAFRQGGAVRTFGENATASFLAAPAAGLALTALGAHKLPAWRDLLQYLTIFPAAIMVAAAMRCRGGALAAVLNSATARWLAMVSFGTY
jgi:peptidoglycan/LPS O-acetylase OafA/YrhL